MMHLCIDRTGSIRWLYLLTACVGIAQMWYLPVLRLQVGVTPLAWHVLDLFVAALVTGCVVSRCVDLIRRNRSIEAGVRLQDQWVYVFGVVLMSLGVITGVACLSLWRVGSDAVALSLQTDSDLALLIGKTVNTNLALLGLLCVESGGSRHA